MDPQYPNVSSRSGGYNLSCEQIKNIIHKRMVNMILLDKAPLDQLDQYPRILGKAERSRQQIGF